MLLEYTRLHRAPADFACVLYRDVGFREAPRTSSLTRQGPECLDGSGHFREHLIVVTGHVSLHPSITSRFRTPFAAIVFLRDPLSRLLSLFNMYPEGTYGKPPKNASTPALRFAAAYRRRLAGRNALTCFVSGALLCDSVGSLRPHAIGPSALRRARFHLAHRYDAFGLTERSEESLAMIAWAMGWEAYYRERFLSAVDDAPSAAGSLVGPIAPGSEHRRVAMAELCAVPALIDEMRRHESYDVRLHQFAAVLFAQRLDGLPEDARALVHAARARAAQRGSSPGPEHVDVCGQSPVRRVEAQADEEAGGLTADDAAIWP